MFFFGIKWFKFVRLASRFSNLTWKYEIHPVKSLTLPLEVHPSLSAGWFANHNFLLVEDRLAVFKFVVDLQGYKFQKFR